MIAVIVAGGSGTRLWPLSTPDKPKHLLSLTGDLSLLQEAYERAKLFADEVYVVTDHSHSVLVAGQLKELDEEHIIVEPGRRGTASCNTLALAKLAQKYDLDTQVGFIHADHHIQNREGFAEAVTFAAEAAASHNSIGLIGIHPDYPSTGFGYIKVGKRLNGAFNVNGFKEKPDEKTAEEYVESGKYLWNLGLFAAPIRVFRDELKEHNEAYFSAFNKLGSLTGDELKDAYLSLPNEPIETQLIERTSKTIVVPGTFDWADIGSYKDLHDVMPKTDEDRNVVQGDKAKVNLVDAKNSLVVGNNKPVAVVGVENIAVIDSPDGLLVCSLEQSQKVKDASSTL